MVQAGKYHMCVFSLFVFAGVNQNLGNVLSGDYDKMCIKNVTCFAFAGIILFFFAFVCISWLGQ